MFRNNLGILVLLLTLVLGCASSQIHEAAKKGDINKINSLLDSGVDVNKGLDFSYHTPLITAIEANQIEVVKLLIKRGANVNNVNKEFKGRAPMYSAIEKGNLEIVKILLENKADLNAKSGPEICSPLHCAVFFNQFFIVKLLVQYGAALDSLDKYGNTPLDAAKEYMASRKYNFAIAPFLENAHKDSPEYKVYERYLNMNTAHALKDFLQKHPKSKYKDKALEKFEELLEIEKSLKYDDGKRELPKIFDYGDIHPLISSYPAKSIDTKKWLFVIGIENYDNTVNVPFSNKSAQAFKETAQKVFGIAENNTYIIIGTKATSGTIKNKLDRLTRRVRKGDTIYFYYSGHGVPDPLSKEAFILPRDMEVDFIGKEDDFRLSNIYNKLSNSKASKIFAFIDACFSGRTGDNKFIFKGVAPGLIKIKKTKFNNKKMVTITAGRENQFSNSHDQKKYRMFSYFLIKNLLKGRDRDLKSIYRNVFVEVKDASWKKGDIYLQEPQIEGNSNLKLWPKSATNVKKF